MREPNRRSFIVTCLGTLVLSFPRGEPVRVAAGLWCGVHRPRPTGPHPTPRPGITGAHVLGPDDLATTPDLIPLFDQMRAIPEVVDGIRCQCGCAGGEQFYSLLSCYEGDGMARFCNICQGQGRLAHRLHAAGQSLDEIRAAIDARYG